MGYLKVIKIESSKKQQINSILWKIRANLLIFLASGSMQRKQRLVLFIIPPVPLSSPLPSSSSFFSILKAIRQS